METEKTNYQQLFQCIFTVRPTMLKDEKVPDTNWNFDKKIIAVCTCSLLLNYSLIQLV